MKIKALNIWFSVFCSALLLLNNVLYAGNQPDTVQIKADQLIMLKDSIIAPLIDTSIYIPEGVKYKVRKNPYYRSARFYDSLYYKSRKSALYRNLYALTIRYSPMEADNVDMIESVDEFIPYEGKTISSIKIVKTDILEGSVYDTNIKAISGFGKFLNRVHIGTTDKTIKRNLLFKVGKELHPVILSDNERILRQMRSIQDARIEVVPSKKNPDEVEVIVITQDVFPWVLGVDMKDWDRYNIRLENINMFGMSQELGNKFMLDFDKKPVLGNDAYYSIANIAGTFIDARLNYYNAFSTEWFNMKFNKAFVSHLTKWGGAVDLEWMDSYLEVSENDSSYNIPYMNNSQEYWLGRAFKLGDISRRQNIILSGLMSRKYFTERPEVFPDSNYFFHNRETYLFSVRFDKIVYYKVQLLKSFGKIEDLPTGYTIGITGGYVRSEFYNRPYLGFDMAFSKRMKKLGYFGARAELGGLINDSKYSQAAFLASLRWFSTLQRSRLNRIRYFLELEFNTTVVNDRNKEIDFSDEINGFSNGDIGGRSTLILKHETVMFTPLFFYGFRFAPYFHADIGMISDHSRVLKSASMYYSFGIGIRIRNESLAYNTIVIRLSYLPRTGSGSDIWDLHFSSSANDYFNTLELRKPRMVESGVVNLFE